MKTFRSAFIRPTCELSKRTFSLRYSSPRQMFTEPFIKRAILLLENPFTFRGSAFSSKQIVDRWKSLKLLSILSIRFYNWKSKRRETLMNSFQHSRDDRWRIFSCSIFSTRFFLFSHQLRHVSFCYSRSRNNIRRYFSTRLCPLSDIGQVRAGEKKKRIAENRNK